MPERLPEVLLDLHKWDQLSRAECVQIAFQVERLLPPSFRFTKIKTYASTSDLYHVAYFQWTAPPGPSLTHADLQIDPNYPYRALTRHLDAHEDLLALPEKEKERIQKNIEELVHWCKPTFSRKQYATTFALIPGGIVTPGYDRQQRLLFRVEAGKIVEYWLCADILQLLQQVGMIPS